MAPPPIPATSSRSTVNLGPRSSRSSVPTVFGPSVSGSVSGSDSVSEPATEAGSESDSGSPSLHRSLRTTSPTGTSMPRRRTSHSPFFFSAPIEPAMPEWRPGCRRVLPPHPNGRHPSSEPGSTQQQASNQPMQSRSLTEVRRIGGGAPCAPAGSPGPARRSSALQAPRTCWKIATRGSISRGLGWQTVLCSLRDPSNLAAASAGLQYQVLPVKWLRDRSLVALERNHPGEGLAVQSDARLLSYLQSPPPSSGSITSTSVATTTCRSASAAACSDTSVFLS